MLRRIAAIGISWKITVFRSNLPKPRVFSDGKLRSARTDFAPVFFIASLVLMASALAGCANQNLAGDRPLVKSDTVQQSHSNSTPAAKAAAKSQLTPIARTTAESPSAPSPEERGPSRASPEQAGISESTSEQTSSSAAARIPNNARPMAIVQPGPAAENGRSASSPQPRTVRALNCRQQMLKEHPTVLFGEKGSAAAQRDHFQSCMRRAGNEQ